MNLPYDIIEIILFKLDRAEWINISLLNKEYHSRFFNNKKFILRIFEKLDPDWFRRESKTKVIQQSYLEDLKKTIELRLERKKIIAEIEKCKTKPKQWNILKEYDSLYNLRVMYSKMVK